MNPLPPRQPPSRRPPSPRVAPALLASLLASGLMLLAWGCDRAYRTAEKLPEDSGATSATKLLAAVAPPEVLEARAIALLATGKQDRAEELLAHALSRYPNAQRIVYWNAVCERSRFNVMGAARLFTVVARMDAETPAGKCSEHVLAIDANHDVDRHFDDLRRLADANPDDLSIRWMLAVLCRSLDRQRSDSRFAEEGVRHYARLLDVWKPGPVLIHQTLANLLDELNRYEESLVHRRLAVQLAPAGWSYHGLAMTLRDLRRYPEACDACAKAVACAPQSGNYWISYAGVLDRAGRSDEAVAASERALALDPFDREVLSFAGTQYAHNGRYHQALNLYQRALKIDPRSRNALYGKREMESCVRVIGNQLPADIPADRGAEQAVTLFANGNGTAAEAMLAALVRRYPKDSRLALYWALTRVEGLYTPYSEDAIEMALAGGTNTVYGLAAWHLKEALREHDRVQHQAALFSLSERHAADPMLLWAVVMAGGKMVRLDDTTLNALFRLRDIWKPGSSPLHYKLWGVYSVRGETEAAVTAARSAVAATECAFAYRCLAEQLAKLRKTDEVDDAMLRACQLADRLDFALTHCLWGDLCNGASRHAEALDHYRDAIKNDATYGDAHIGMGVSLAALQRPAEARQCFEAALRIDPGSKLARQHLTALVPPADAAKP